MFKYKEAHNAVILYDSGSVIEVLQTGLAVYPNSDPRPENRLI
jgi:hypothetical protein